MGNLQHIESAARRKLGAHEDWKGYQFEAVAGDYIVVGSVPVGTFSRGRRKGQPKWDGPGTKVLVSGGEVGAEVARYVEATGNCPDCLGTKEEFARWNVKEGTTMAPCSKCGATGKAKAG
jgi:hypothetical protein